MSDYIPKPNIPTQIQKIPMVLSWRVPRNLKMLEDPEVVCHLCAYPEEFDIIHDECLDKVQEASWGLDNSECVFFCKRIVGEKVSCFLEPLA